MNFHLHICGGGGGGREMHVFYIYVHSSDACMDHVAPQLPL